MNIHELAELIGPPSCIIALDWSKALGARPDPGERGEPDWQRRASPTDGRTPRRHRRHGSARLGTARRPPLRSADSPAPLPGQSQARSRLGRPLPPPATEDAEPEAGGRQGASLRPSPGGAEGTAAAFRRPRRAAGVLVLLPGPAPRSAPADGGGTGGQSGRPPPARPPALRGRAGALRSGPRVPVLPAPPELAARLLPLLFLQRKNKLKKTQTKTKNPTKQKWPGTGQPAHLNLK